MTTGGFREVDHELLADYVGGALSGTPDEVTVARLVEEDAAWADAYAQLAPAVAEVHAALLAYGTAEGIPAAVADQIHTALAATHDATTEGAPAEGATASGTARPSGAVVPAQPHAGSRRPGGVPRVETAGPGRRRRRWQRVGAPVALAAVAVAAVGLLGLDQLDGGTDSPGSSTGTTEQAVAGPMGTTAPPIRTGTDYQREDLAAPVPSPQQFSGQDTPETESSGVEIQGDRVTGPMGLDRLADPAALEACLTEIGVEHDAGRLAVEVVDYARFEGQPAVVVRFTDATGARWAWVSGPECGVPGSGPDTRYRTQVG